MLKCNNNCPECRKFTSVHGGVGYTEYNCIIMNKTVTIYCDENKEIEKIEIY